MLRTFFAINLPENIQERIHHLIQQLKLLNLPIHWVEPNNLHITLQFLKDISPKDIENIVKNVRFQVQHIHVFKLELHQIELFPTTLAPHILSIAPKANDTLSLLSHLIGVGILATNYPIETRSYRAHLTLGRFIEPPQSLAVQNIRLSNPIIFPITEIVYYKSNRTDNNIKYTVLDKIPLL